MMQKPAPSSFSDRYNYERMIFQNDVNALKAISGHPNIVSLVDVVEDCNIETIDEVNGGEPMKVDIALVLECIKGGELYYNLRKYGKFTP